MTGRAYLAQAFWLDQRINSKIAQVASLRDLASKVTSTVTDMPRSATPSTHRMEDIIIKIFALEEEINADIDALVDLKREMVRLVKAVDNVECQILLEQRYLCFKTWEQIAVAMVYSIQHTYRMHDQALRAVVVPQHERKCDCMRVAKVLSYRVED